ncbi:1-hydroxy-2-methyl-2-butenyl 4-diphosphate reductase [Streptomyces sp. NPDC056835]|uniref:phosphorylase family protein n=1 Tax=Streptomyces sp. NPDC056835 TaxID=3345956 RepID=UPI0036A92A0C
MERSSGPSSAPSSGPSASPAPRPAAPLLIACALGIERFALRPGRAGAAAPVTVLRTGMGPKNAERAVARVLAEARNRDAAVIASGFCAGLVPGMNPGDLIVADETRHPDGSTPCTGTALLVDALARVVPGHTVHTGPLTGSDHVVRGQERAELRATGAVAVDMESAATLRSALSAGSRPVAAVRVVVDAPEHELVRIGTVRGGISAFRVLRAVLPAFHEWHRSLLLPRR